MKEEESKKEKKEKPGKQFSTLKQKKKLKDCLIQLKPLKIHFASLPKHWWVSRCEF